MADLKETSFRQELTSLFEKFNVIFDIDESSACIHFHSVSYPEGRAVINESIKIVLDRESELMDFAATRIV